jgi:hypothetical protein
VSTGAQEETIMTTEQIDEAAHLAEAIDTEMKKLVRDFNAKHTHECADIKDAAAVLNVLTAAQWHFARKSERLRKALAETGAG